MYKIFVDTNVILEFYRLKDKINVKNILEEIKKYKKYFISTEQFKDEFLRSRNSVMTDFIKEISLKHNVRNDSFIATLKIYPKYKKIIKDANKCTDELIEEINELIENPENDLVYKIFLELSEKSYKRTDEIVEKARKRKLIGNPPMSNKDTCGDEIIWETILENCNDDLVIVSKDKTFSSNYSFLRKEFKDRKGKAFKAVETISEAIKINKEQPSTELENVESDLIVGEELKRYGQLQEGANWANIIYNALTKLENEADLKDIYREAEEIVNRRYPNKAENKGIEATIRGTLQRYSSDSNFFNGKYDLFKKIKNGRWAIRKI